MHNLTIARYYWEVKYKTQGRALKGAQSRLKEIVDKYPCFSYNDEVLYRLASTYQAEEEPDEAANTTNNCWLDSRKANITRKLGNN